MEDIYGFVYLWFDRHHKKFCVGSHYGKLNDGYVTSTGHMCKAYAKRREDFKRRILWWLREPDYKSLLESEQRFLDMIKDEELGVKYYNLKKCANGTVKGWKHRPDTRAKISESSRGRTLSVETRAKISLAKKQLSDQARDNIRAARLGKKHTKETCAKIGAREVSAKTRAKMSLSHQGKLPWNAGLKGVQVPWNKGLKKNTNEART